jgi:hypothetical protein
MHYVHNKKTNDTVLVALMSNGVLASFVIERNYQVVDPKKEYQTNNTLKLEEPLEQNKVTKKTSGVKKDRVQSFQSLLFKLLEDEDTNLDLFDDLDEDER